jgi:hypothetical protein
MPHNKLEVVDRVLKHRPAWRREGSNEENGDVALVAMARWHAVSFFFVCVCVLCRVVIPWEATGALTLWHSSSSSSSSSSAVRVPSLRASAAADDDLTPPPRRRQKTKHARISYEGLVRDDTPHAYGVLEFPNRDRYACFCARKNTALAIRRCVAKKKRTKRTHATHTRTQHTGMRASWQTAGWTATACTCGATAREWW